MKEAETAAPSKRAVTEKEEDQDSEESEEDIEEESSEEEIQRRSKNSPKTNSKKTATRTSKKKKIATPTSNKNATTATSNTPTVPMSATAAFFSKLKAKNTAEPPKTSRWVKLLLWSGENCPQLHSALNQANASLDPSNLNEEREKLIANKYPKTGPLFAHAAKIKNQLKAI